MISRDRNSIKKTPVMFLKHNSCSIDRKGRARCYNHLNTFFHALKRREFLMKHLLLNIVFHRWRTLFLNISNNHLVEMNNISCQCTSRQKIRSNLCAYFVFMYQKRKKCNSSSITIPSKQTLKESRNIYIFSGIQIEFRIMMSSKVFAQKYRNRITVLWQLRERQKSSRKMLVFVNIKQQSLIV